MQVEFHSLEESLKSFLIDAQSDSYNEKSINFYKYNNLKIYMDPKKIKDPHFVVRVGISESVYSLDNCERLLGGIGGDERYIHRWFERSSIKSDLQDAWSKTLKFEPVQMKSGED